MSTMRKLHQTVHVIPNDRYFLVQLNESLIIHLISLKNTFTGLELTGLQEYYQKLNQQLIQLWEDVWASKRLQVINRIHSFLGLNKSIHGRKCRMTALTTVQSRAFYDAYHLQGYVKAEQTYGLILNEELIAAASFSKTRPMKLKGPSYRSAELIRFASKDNFTVVGGLSKLIKHFLKNTIVNDLMTYADRDWSLGNGYDRLGFTLTEVTAPADLYVNCETLERFFPHRLPKAITETFEHQQIINFEDYLANQGFVKAFNTGNLKYHLYCS